MATAKQKAAAARNLVKARAARWRAHGKKTASRRIRMNTAFTGKMTRRGNPVRSPRQRAAGVRRGAGMPTGPGIQQVLAKKAIDRMPPGMKRSVAASKYRKQYGIPKVKRLRERA